MEMALEKNEKLAVMSVACIPLRQGKNKSFA